MKLVRTLILLLIFINAFSLNVNAEDECRCDTGVTYTNNKCIEGLAVLCLDIYEPVCGCDGVTYPNACNAGASGIKKYLSGACDIDRAFTGTWKTRNSKSRIIIKVRDGKAIVKNCKANSEEGQFKTLSEKNAQIVLSSGSSIEIELITKKQILIKLEDGKTLKARKVK